MIASLLSALTGRVTKLVGAPLFIKFFPWIVLAICLAFGALWLANAGLRLDLAKAETRYQTLQKQHAKLEKEAAEFALAVAQREAQLAREHRARLLEIETRYREELDHAAESSDRLAADLRSERTVRVRKALNCPARPNGVPGTGPGGPGTVAAADDPAAIIGRVDRIGAEADAMIRALQSVVIEDRKRCKT